MAGVGFTGRWNPGWDFGGGGASIPSPAPPPQRTPLQSFLTQSTPGGSMGADRNGPPGVTGRGFSQDRDFDVDPFGPPDTRSDLDIGWSDVAMAAPVSMTAAAALAAAMGLNSLNQNAPPTAAIAQPPAPRGRASDITPNMDASRAAMAAAEAAIRGQGGALGMGPGSASRSQSGTVGGRGHPDPW